MTNKQLQEKLKEFPDDDIVEVCLVSGDREGYFEIDNVQIDLETKKVFIVI